MIRSTRRARARIVMLPSKSSWHTTMVRMGWDDLTIVSGSDRTVQQFNVKRHSFGLNIWLEEYSPDLSLESLTRLSRFWGLHDSTRSSISVWNHHVELDFSIHAWAKPSESPTCRKVGRFQLRLTYMDQDYAKPEWKVEHQYTKLKVLHLLMAQTSIQHQSARRFDSDISFQSLATLALPMTRGSIHSTVLRTRIFAVPQHG